jgi:rhodanese-related sulfurtransferase
MKSITTDRLQKLQNESDDFLLVNTLDAEHFPKTKIPGSVNIPQSQDDFTAKVLEASGSKQKLVVTYCASEECNSSTQAAKKLEDAGFNVADYEGGAKAWKDAGQPLAV